MRKIVILQREAKGHYFEWLNHILETLDKKYSIDLVVSLELKDKIDQEFSKKINKFINVDNYSNFQLYLYLIKQNYFKAVFLTAPEYFFLSILLPIKSYLIFYKIHLYSAKKRDYIKFFLITLITRIAPFVRCVFFLNDKQYFEKINNFLLTTKYNFLPDPVKLISNKKNTTKLYDVGHFGVLSERKGTLMLINSIITLNDKYITNPVSLCIGGFSDKKIRDQIKYKLNDLEKSEFIGNFLSETKLINLMSNCKIIAIPYENVYQSSGILNLSAALRIPVVAPNEGMLGYLIKTYNLGWTYNNNKDLPSVIGKALSNFNKQDNNFKFEQYLRERCSLYSFKKIIDEKI